MACNVPSYPPPASSSGNWGNRWGKSWSSSTDPAGGWGSNWGASWGTPAGSGNSWDSAYCIAVDYQVPPPLLVVYRVPAILGVDYSAEYASPLAVNYNIPPPLQINYKVAEPLTVSFDTEYASPLTVRYPISQPLGIEYSVLRAAPLSASFEVQYASANVISYQVPQNLVAEYTVPDAYRRLEVDYDVPANYRSLVVSFDAEKGYGLFCTYDVIPSTYYGPLAILYSSVEANTDSSLLILYATDSSADASGIDGATADGLVSMSVSASEGAINVSAVVLESHVWAGASPGDMLSGYAGNRLITFKVTAVSYDKEKCTYSISGRQTVDSLLDKLVDNVGNAIWVPDPVRERIESTGAICIEDLDIRNDVSRPTVGAAIYAAAASAGVNIVLDHDIPGLDDLVPFDQFYGKPDITLGDVIKSLIGWVKPYYFLDGNTLRVVGGRPANAIGVPPTNVDFNVRVVNAYDIPRRVTVTGGPWPDKYDPPHTTGGGCGGDSPEPSEMDDYVLHEVTTTKPSGEYIGEAQVLERRVERTITKRDGRIVGEVDELFIDILVPAVVSYEPYSITGHKKKTLLGEKTIVTYDYIGDCADALARRESVTYRTFNTLFSNPDEVGFVDNLIHSGGGGGLKDDNAFVYKRVLEEWQWNRKGYVERHNTTTTKATQLETWPTTQGWTLNIIYASNADGEIWLPWGNGLWFHKVFAPEMTVTEVTFVEGNPDTGGDAYVWGTTIGESSFSEVTESGPQTSDCVVPPSACSPRCKTTSSPGAGLTKYREGVDIAGGDDKDVSIRVPGLNAYWPLPKLLRDDSEPPPMSIAQPYADYAARARKTTGYLRDNYVICLGDSGSVLGGVVIENQFRLPGEYLHGGLITSSSMSVDADGKISGSYQITYFA